MSVSLNDVEKIAELARLRVSQEEKKKFTEQLNIILEYMNKLNKVDTSQIEPLSHPLELTNVFREDKVEESLPLEKVLMNAPSKTDKYFKVPKVINK